jgi:hypothetical protein
MKISDLSESEQTKQIGIESFTASLPQSNKKWI